MTAIRHLSIAGLCLAATALAPVSVRAASEAAWDEFRLEMNEQCLALAADLMSDVEIRIDPFGSESYGNALLTGAEDGQPVSRICVMDKQTKAVELGGPLPGLADGIGDEALQEAPEDAQVTCDAACEATEAMLSDSDVQSLRGTAGVVAATLDDLAGKQEPQDAETQRIAELVAAGAPDLDFAAVAPGDYQCSVYWYGFLDQGARKVGTHQCEVSEAEGGLRVEKVSGERLDAVLHPFADGVRAYIGRTFLQGHAQTEYDQASPSNAENENFGNKVGLALADKGRLYLISTQARGMQPQDPTFFEVMELTPAA